jgi:death-on-curing family protein
MSEIYYPTEEKVIEYNLLCLTLIKVKKADQPKVLNYIKLQKVLEKCKDNKGDIYDKAVVLIKGLVKGHVFASGNRRTAFITTKDFLTNNNSKLKVKNDPEYAKVMTGIREGYYSDDEIKEWIKNGKIRKFER